MIGETWPFACAFDGSGLILAVTSFSFPIGLIGFAIGAYIGLRQHTADHGLPLTLGLILGTCFYLTAEVLIVVIAVAAVVGLIGVLLLYWRVVEQGVNRLARASGRFLASRQFIVRGRQLTAEFFRRQEFLAGLPLENQQAHEQLLTAEEDHYRRAIATLRDRFPYLDGEESHGARGNILSTEDLYDQE